MVNSFKKELIKHRKVKGKSQLVTVRLPSDLFKKLEKLADETGVSKSQILISALKKALVT